MIAVTARLDIPDHLKPKATYALRELCYRAGFGLRIVDTENPNIFYGVQFAPPRSGGLFLHCNERLYRPETICKVHLRQGVEFWDEAILPADEEPDLIGGAYRLLTALDETQVAAEARDAKGTFLAEALPVARRAAAQRPLIELHAEALLQMLTSYWPNARALSSPRWPDRKKFVLVLSHDCDHLDISSPAEIATSLAKAILRGNSAHAAVGLLGIRNFLRSEPNPYFKLGWWRQWEQQRRIRSTFFFFYRPSGVRFALNDCKSTARCAATDWGLIREMAQNGWEIGLHAPIRMRDHGAGFRLAREWLTERTGRRITGLRHHYFAIDWRRPFLTHRMHAEAGFEYDSSIAFRGAPGFRTGTSLPYRPFDPVRNEEIPLLVLPCSLMDEHIMPERAKAQRHSEAEIVAGMQIVMTVRDISGTLVMDWHQESAFNRILYEGYIDVLDQLLNECMNGNAWVATAEELCVYWNHKRRDLDTCTDLLSNYANRPNALRADLASGHWQMYMS